MPVKTISTGRALMGGGTYADKVLGTGPIAYWPLWEANGTVARCLVNPAQNGTYSSAVNTWPVGVGIGDGNTAPEFDGINDHVNIFSAALTAGFNGGEGTMVIWCRVANAGIWTDGTIRYSFYMFTDNDNNVYTHARTGANDIVRSRYEASTVAELQDHTAGPSISWFHAGITWDINAGINGEVRHYLNGAQNGATDTALGAWVGALSRAHIGASNIPITDPWAGGLAHAAIWNRALPASVIAVLATI